MTNEDEKYSEYVEHPRFGRGPRYTGLNPDPMAPDVQLHWHSTSQREIALRYETLLERKWPFGGALGDADEIKRIPNTAIVSDLTRQTVATVSVTHYFDLDRTCRDCKRPFIFFAEEQKHWYEELHFGLDSDCVRCVPCRKRQQVLAKNRKRYEELSHIPQRSSNENLEMAACYVSFCDDSDFKPKRLQVVRALLNRVSSDADESITSRCTELADRVRSIEAMAAKKDIPPGRR